MITSLDTILFLAPALAAGAIISLAHVPLGIEVLRRGIIFLDLAVAQFAALGMVAFQTLLQIDKYSFLGMYGPLVAGLAGALICAGTFHLLEKRAGQHQEALIGGAFVLGACLTLILMNNDPHGGEEMKNILAGQILWTNWSNLIIPALVFTVVALLWFTQKQRRQKLFYPLFAITIPFSVNLVGIYLVFSSLIFPALAVINAENHKIKTGIIITIISYTLGLGLSYLCDWPSGPSIALSLALISFIFFSFFIKKPKMS